LLDAVAQRLEFRGVQVQRLQIRDLSPQALILADFGHPTISRATGQVAKAVVVVMATPVCKSAYSGVLKVFLDLLSHSALEGKTVLPLATGGSPSHMLVMDYALRPVLQSLGAMQILPAIYANDSQVAVSQDGAYEVNAEIAQRLDDAVNNLVREVLPAHEVHARRFAPVQFSRVRCSV
jgi:FMN reductase